MWYIYSMNLCGRKCFIYVDIEFELIHGANLTRKYGIHMDFCGIYHRVPSFLGPKIPTETSLDFSVGHAF